MLWSEKIRIDKWKILSFNNMDNLKKIKYKYVI